MNEEVFKNLINHYFRFRDNLKNKIYNNNISFANEDCYLIEKNWSQALLNCFSIYKNTRYLSLPKYSPNFINNYVDLIKCIKNKKKFELISKNIIRIIYQDELKNNNIVNYYGGYGQLIIEYKKKMKRILYY